ncbi:MAG: hypothetical protein WC526_04755 [Patescibacteria group bacterium]
MQSTVKIFRYLYEHLPPLFPADMNLKMKAELGALESQPNLPVTKVEDIMIGFGYEVWPWNQAYKEFLEAAEQELGEHFLLPNLSEAAQEKYAEFKEYLGTLHDLHSGKAAEFFSSEQRGELCTALVDMQTKLKDYVDREILGLNNKKYLQRVEEFKLLIEDLKNHIEDLRRLAAAETDHPNLADEIKDKIRTFEYSLCMLGPELQFDAVCQAKDFFAGRKQDLNRLRGIHVPLQIDLYN